MKQIIFLCLITTLIQNAIAQQIATYDVLHYNFFIQLEKESDNIKGKASIQLQCITEGIIAFDLENKTSTKGMTVKKVLVNNAEVSFTHEKRKLYIAQPIKPIQQYNVDVYYEGIPSDGLIISKNKYGNRTFFGDNWPNRAHCWLPCNDNIADKATVTFTVNAPDIYEVISNGIIIKENATNGRREVIYHCDVPVPTKVMVIGVADFAIKSEKIIADSIPVYSYLYPEDSVKGTKDYAKAVQILAWFIKKVGPYNYKKLANVQSTTIFGGMENASAIFYSEDAISGDYKNEDLIAHEIAHQWFGNTATEKSYAHLWLSEGFATYFASLYMKDMYGDEVFLNRMRSDRSKVLRENVTGPLVNSSSDYMSLLNAYSYQKGAWLLHMLRMQIGDEAFNTVIQNYYKAYRNKNADSDDFIAEVFKVTGNRMDAFFNQMLYVKENPNLRISYTYNKKKKTIDITIKQLSKNVFTIPVTVQCISGNNNVNVTCNLTKAVEVFSKPISFAPKAIKIDPNVALLATIQIK